MLCDRLQAFHDGELAPAEAAEFRVHLAGCERCSANLLTLMQIGALADETRREAAKVVPLASRRKKLWLAVPVVLAAAAAVALWMRRDTPAPAIALAGTRAVETRVSWDPGDRFRPYAVERSSEAAGEVIPLSTLAALEKDPRALAGAYLLMGDGKAAAIQLNKAPASADRESDLAALKLAEGQPEEALGHAAAALELEPTHGPALWNKALALRDLGLPLGAAAAFERIEDAGWKDEARGRAEKLRGEAEAAARSYQEMLAASTAMVQGGPPVSEALASAHPASVRLFLYHALRASGSRERVQVLAPLASSLDRRFASSELGREVDRLLGLDFASRRELGARYARLATDESIDLAGARALLARVDAAPPSAGMHDLALGLLTVTDLGVAEPARLRAEVARSGDPWFADLPVLLAVRAAREDGKTAEAQVLADQLARCTVAYRCMQLEFALGESLLVRFHRPVTARPHFLRAARLAGEMADWATASQIVGQLGQTTKASGELALASAYLEEGIAAAALVADPAVRCFNQRWSAVQLASVHVNRFAFSEAWKTLRGTPACQDGESIPGLLLIADLARFGISEEERKKFLAQVQGLRDGAPTDGAALAFADYLEGRSRGDEALLRRAIVHAETALTDVYARQARQLAHASLITLAAERGDFAGVLDGFAAEAGLARPERCAAGIAIDDGRLIFAVRDAAGQARGELRTASRPVEPHRELFPASLARSLVDCPAVDVFAFAPFHGSPVLPADLAWHFVHRGEAGEARRGPRLIVADTRPPAALDLPRLAPWADDGDAAAIRLLGDAATPARALAEMRTAGEIEVHAHGLVSGDASMLVLSPDREGNFGLSVSELERQRFTGRPLVMLAACETTQTAPYLHEIWSLPGALLGAGASGVVASSVPIPDADASRFFAGLRKRLAGGQALAQAVRDERVAWLKMPGREWVSGVIVFESLLPGGPAQGGR